MWVCGFIFFFLSFSLPSLSIWIMTTYYRLVFVCVCKSTYIFFLIKKKKQLLCNVNECIQSKNQTIETLILFWTHIWKFIVSLCSAYLFHFGLAFNYSYLFVNWLIKINMRVIKGEKENMVCVFVFFWMCGLFWGVSVINYNY